MSTASPSYVPNATGISCRAFDLKEIVDMARSLRKNGKPMVAARLVLCGIAEDPGCGVAEEDLVSLEGVPEVHEMVAEQLRQVKPAFRIQLDISRYNIPLDARVELERYYSLVVGISRCILVTGSDLVLTTKRRTQNEFSALGHLTHTWKTIKGYQRVELAAIPHCRLAKFKKGNVIVAIFPQLNTSGHTSMTIEHYRLAWELAILPAAQSLPLFKDNGQGIISESNIPAFATSIRKLGLQSAVPWLGDILFVHVGSCRSPPHTFHFGSGCIALEPFLKGNSLGMAEMQADTTAGGVWSINVDLELTMEGTSLLWAGEEHTSMYKEVFGVPVFDPEFNDYHRQYVSHLTYVSGCQITPTDPSDYAARTEPSYFALQHVENKMTAVDQSGALLDRIRLIHLAQNPKDKPSFLRSASHLYETEAQETIARVTVRVPVATAAGALLSLSETTLRRACVAMSPNVLRDWRHERLLAMNTLMEGQRAQSKHYAGYQHDATLLGVSLAHLTNSLHISPEDYIRCPPPYPYTVVDGILFLQNVVTWHGAGDLPRFERVPFTRETDAFCQEWTGGTLSEVIQALKKQGHAIPMDAVPMPSPGARLPFRFAMPYLEWSSAPPSPFTGIKGVVCADEEDARTFTTDPYIQDALDEVTHLFYADILEGAPYDPNGNSCLRVNVDAVNLKGLLGESNLAKVFRACKWKRASQTDWVRVFEIYFPKRSTWSAESYPALASTRYYWVWGELLDVMSTVGRDILRRGVWNTIFKQIRWIPSPKDGIIWSVAPSKNYRDEGNTRRACEWAPRVLYNGDEESAFLTKGLL